MKKAVKLHLKGTVQSMFFRQFIKNNADANNVFGFLRKMEDGSMEVFIEGDGENVRAMINICKTGPKHAVIREVTEKEERFQGFKDFKIMSI